MVYMAIAADLFSDELLPAFADLRKRAPHKLMEAYARMIERHKTAGLS